MCEPSPDGGRRRRGGGGGGGTGDDLALTSTIYAFGIRLADMDRGVYESLTFRVARHPSETEDYLVTRVLAYCLEYCDGIGFSGGIAEPDEPAIAVRDLTGALRAWIDIGTPDAARLHKASKAAPRVVVYTHKDPGAARPAAGGGADPPARKGWSCTGSTARFWRDSSLVWSAAWGSTSP